MALDFEEGKTQEDYAKEVKDKEEESEKDKENGN